MTDVQRLSSSKTQYIFKDCFNYFCMCPTNSHLADIFVTFGAIQSPHCGHIQVRLFCSIAELKFFVQQVTVLFQRHFGGLN